MIRALVFVTVPASLAWGQAVVLESAADTMDPAPPAPLVLRPPPVVVEGPFVSVQVNTDPATGLDILNDAGNEPSIARSLTDPDLFIIGWRQFDSTASSYRKAGYAYSHDGGAVWSGRGVIDETRQGSDPVLLAGLDGEVYYLTYRYAQSPFATELYRSNDGGATWLGPWNALGGDKAWFDVDRTEGPTRGTMYQIYEGRLRRSRDNGQTWDAAQRTAPYWGQVRVGPQGLVRAAGGGNNGDGVVRVKTALDIGDPDDPPTLDQRTNTEIPGPGEDYQSTPVNPGGIVGQTNLRIAIAGPRTGEIYVLQSAATSTDPLDVQFVYSDDGGASYSAPIRVYDDADGAWQWFGCLGLAPNGRLDAVWYDTRDDANPSNPTSSRIYASYSTDGGRTWAPSFPASPAFLNNVGYPSQAKLGDYIDMSSDDLGASLAYAATFTGGQDVYYLRLGTTDCDANGVPDEMEIAAGLATDADHDWVPDACQCLADLTGDGALNFDDLDAFIAAFLAADPAADLDGTGTVNFDDLDLFITSYLAGCP